MAISDDFTADPATFGRIAVGGYALGTRNFSLDNDWFRVQLTAGQTYVVALQGAPTGVGTLPDPFVQIFNAGGLQLGGDDESGFGAEARLIFTPTTSGTYFLDATGTGTGTYRLSLDRLPVRRSDFSNDRTSDILLLGPATELSANYFAAWFMQGGAYAGGTNLISGLISPAYIPVGTGDFNFDGLADVLFQSGTQVSEVLLDASGHNFAETTLVGVLPTGARVVGTGDFNRDGGTDFVWQNGATVTNVILNRATGAVAATNTLTTALPTGWQVVGVGDVNGDDISDIVLQGGSTVVAWLLNGTGGYAGGSVLTTSLPFGWLVTGTGDFNGDHTSDILVRGGNYVVDWIMQGGNVVGGNVISSSLPASWNVTGTGDYNGDGTSDISLQGGSTVVNWLISNGVYAGGNVLTTELPAGWSVVGKT